jgi:predicted O-methyltransferase YrrM
MRCNLRILAARFHVRPNAMNTLTSAPLSTLLESLFAAAAASDAAFERTMMRYSTEERAAMRAPGTDYRAMAGAAKEHFLAVSPNTGRLLYALARGCKARSIVEFGTSFGISTLHLAAALHDNGGGRLITTELEPCKALRAREHLSTAGLLDDVDLRVGDALETLAADLPHPIDLVLLDGAKGLYLPVLKLLEPRLRSGAWIVTDNASWSPQYLAYVRDPSRYVSVELGGDLELSLHL